MARIWVGMLMVALMGCGPVGSDGEKDGGKCAPGESSVCVCPDGASLGLRTCDASGSSFGACMGCSASQCVDGQSSCQGAGSLAICENGQRTTYNCDSACVSHGYASSSGCGYDSSRGQDVCWCQDRAGPTCSEGAMECTSPITVRVCVNGQWVSATCLDVCIYSGYAYTTGCGYNPITGTDSCYCAPY